MLMDFLCSFRKGFISLQEAVAESLERKGEVSHTRSMGVNNNWLRLTDPAQAGRVSWLHKLTYGD